MKDLGTIKAEGLKLNGSKCLLLKKEPTYLEYHIHEHGVSPDLKKVEAISETDPPPSSIHYRMENVLGSMVCSLGRFLPNLAAALLPLNKLLKADIIWH